MKYMNIKNPITKNTSKVHYYKECKYTINIHVYLLHIHIFFVCLILCFKFTLLLYLRTDTLRPDGFFDIIVDCKL